MADSRTDGSTADYTQGYNEGMVLLLALRTAENNAAYLLPHLKPGMRMLDIGCGPGTISVGLAAAVAPGEFHGVDMETSQVELASAAATKADLSNTKFQVADALKLPFPDEHFEAVHCHAVLTHVPDTAAALAEIKRVLKSGGVFGSREFICDSCFIEPSPANLNGVFKMYADLLKSNGGHPQLGREMRARLVEAGFANVTSSGSFDHYGVAELVEAYTTFMLTTIFGSPMSVPAIERGFATEQEFEEWRKAMSEWRHEPGAFAAWAWGETVGRKP